MSVVKLLASRERGSSLKAKPLPTWMSKRTSCFTFGTKLTEQVSHRLTNGKDSATIERIHIRSEWPKPSPHHPSEFVNDPRTPEKHRGEYFNFADHLANDKAASRTYQTSPDLDGHFKVVKSGSFGVKLYYVPEDK